MRRNGGGLFPAPPGPLAVRPRPVNHLRAISHFGAPQFRGKNGSVSDLLACDPDKSTMTDVATRKRFGLVADEQQRALSGIEFVQGLADGLGCEVTACLAPEPGLCCVKASVS